MASRPKSSNLFHFTKSRETLQSILKNGFWPRYCLEDINWLPESGELFVAFPMVCFCDIPLSRIDEHVGFYGNYGLGMTREWANRNGLNPVQYFAGENTFTTAFKGLINEVDHLQPERVDQFKDNFRHLNSFIKPCEGRMIIGGEFIRKDFYQESEWRYAPRGEPVVPYLTHSDFQNTDILQEHNNKTQETAMLRISPQDIRCIFVKSDADIPPLVNFIQSDLDHFPSSEVKILLSRITSLEAISGDI